MDILISIKTSDFDYIRKHPRLTQIAWEEINDNTTISSNYFIIKHKDYDIPWIESSKTGFDKEMVDKLGMPFEYVYSRLKLSLMNCNLIIGFDLKLIKETLGGELGLEVYDFENVKQLCIKDCSKQYCGVKDSFDELIFPTLSELSKKLFRAFNPSVKEYSAKEDLRIVNYCFRQLYSLGIARTWDVNEVVDYDVINKNLDRYIDFVNKNKEDNVELNNLELILYDKNFIIGRMKEWLSTYNQLDIREKVFWRKSFANIGESSFGNLYTDLLENELSIFSTNYSPFNYYWYKIPIASNLAKFQIVLNEIILFNSTKSIEEKCREIMMNNV